MRLSQQQLNDLLKRNKSLTVEGDKTGTDRLCSAQPERTQGLPLDSAGQREGKVRARFKIVFTVYARRPLDYDNYRLKELQDHVVKVGILQGDEWDILEGCVISKKVDKEEEEKTVVTIYLVALSEQ